MNELGHQSIIRKSFEDQGGLAHKYPADNMLGWPDLIMIGPETGTWFVEVKVIKSAIVGFHRAIKASKKQRLMMDRINAHGGNAVIFVVVVYRDKSQWLVAVPPGTEKLKCPTSTGNPTCVPRERVVGYDVNELLRRYVLQRHSE